MEVIKFDLFKQDVWTESLWRNKVHFWPTDELMASSGQDQSVLLSCLKIEKMF